MNETNPSIWSIKPWWCQPWSIVLTGLTIPTFSWLLLHHWWITLPIAAVIVVWWALFLGIAPAQYKAQYNAQYNTQYKAQYAAAAHQNQTCSEIEKGE